LNKEIIIIAVLVLIFFAGIVALTQEADDELPDIELEETESLLELDFNLEGEEWIRPARWFRSNAGGMALEETQSRFWALRNQYALAINYVSKEELPEYLFSYFNEKYNVEVRILYKKGEQIRAQWILRDEKGNTRLNAVFLEPELEPETEKEYVLTEETTGKIEDEEKEIESLAFEEDEEPEEETEIVINKNVKKRRGFIEIFNENLFLTSEYRFFEDGRTEKTEYAVKNALLLSAEYLLSDNNEDDFKTIYIDYYRYNRSLSLRNIERIFQRDGILDDPVTIAFPRRVMDSVKKDAFTGERLNIYPDFFETDFISAGSKMIFDTDDRGRILCQTLYDYEDKVIWTIKNTWKDNRIVITSKTEDDTVLTAEFAYNSNGDRVLERNFRNGVLERVVSAEGDTEIEELYMNNAVVLRAVWEDGRKISETRVRN
jgi:uncharacterized protein YrzB (UPF0473 family)